MRILIVEDYIDSADALSQLMKVQGYESRVAHSGAHALALVEDWVPEVVLLDLALPDLSGWEVAARITELCLDAPPVLIVVSAFDPDPDMLRATGIRWYLKKPADYAVLRSLLESLASPSANEPVKPPAAESS